MDPIYSVPMPQTRMIRPTRTIRDQQILVRFGKPGGLRLPRRTTSSPSTLTDTRIMMAALATMTLPRKFIKTFSCALAAIPETKYQSR